MRENMFYKKAISVSTTAGRADVSFGKNSDCVTKQKSVHEVYRRLRTASTSIISTCCSHHDNRIDLDNSGRNGRDNQRPTQALVDAHQSFTASDRQTRFISAWGEGASGSAGLVNYYLKSPDMLTMSDIPRCVTSEVVVWLDGCCEPMHAHAAVYCISYCRHFSLPASLLSSVHSSFIIH